jgi:hypothetical protein
MSTSHVSSTSESDQKIIEKMLELIGLSDDHSLLALLAIYQDAFPSLPRARLLQCASKASSVMLDALLKTSSKASFSEKI